MDGFNLLKFLENFLERRQNRQFCRRSYVYAGSSVERGKCSQDKVIIFFIMDVT